MTLFANAGLEPIASLPGAAVNSSSFKVSGRSHCFDGHFDGAPILPGVAHIALALSACAAQSGQPVVLKALRDFRLKHPLKPGDEVEVVLSAGSNATTTRFEVRCRGEAVSSGLLVVEAGSVGARG